MLYVGGWITTCLTTVDNIYFSKKVVKYQLSKKLSVVLFALTGESTKVVNPAGRNVISAGTSRMDFT